jgi:hypothetical protein
VLLEGYLSVPTPVDVRIGSHSNLGMRSRKVCFTPTSGHSGHAPGGTAYQFSCSGGFAILITRKSEGYQVKWNGWNPWGLAAIL